MNELTEVKSDIAAEINRHHGLAVARAGEAIQHVIAAGKLLLEVKAALPHGQFGEWMAANIQVSARQAQRYIAVAQGKPLPVRAIAAKNDTVSYLSRSPESVSAAEYVRTTIDGLRKRVGELRIEHAALTSSCESYRAEGIELRKQVEWNKRRVAKLVANA